MDKNIINQPIKEIFSQCLEDPDIRKRLQEILPVQEERIQSLEGREAENCITGGLESKIDLLLAGQDVIKKILRHQFSPGRIPVFDSSDASYEKLKEEKRELEGQLLQAKKEHQAYQEKLRDAETALRIWRSALEQNDEVRDYLRQLCGSEGFYAFLSLGRDEGKISQLWEYLKNEAVKQEADQGTVKALQEFFLLCLEVYNQGSDQKYEIFEPEVGEEFDAESYVKASQSAQVGEVCEVLVAGARKKGWIKYKPIVRVS